MKRKLLLGISIASLLILTGCNAKEEMEEMTKETPRQVVESHLKKYQTGDDSVLNDIMFDDEDMDEEIKSNYKDIVKENYKKIKYDVKDEEIDGDSAIVTVELEVISFNKTIEDVDKYYKENENEFKNDNVFDPNLLHKYRIDRFKENEEKEKFTVEYSLTKTNDKWKLDNPTQDMKDKINGIYK